MARVHLLTKKEGCDIMAIKDRNGCLHSEANGRLISKNDADKLKKLERVYNTHGHLNETEREPTKLDEPQRVSKGKEYALAPSLLKKREYREKFDLMTEDPKRAEVFFDIAKAILTHRGGSNGEDVYIYDSVSGDTKSSIAGKFASKTQYTPEFEKWIAQKYPQIEYKEILVDNLCMQLVQKPEQFDVLVLPNLYGDIVSDLGAGLIGGLGVAQGANIGVDCAVFEPVHGSAPDIKGQNKANPTALLLSAIEMLNYINEKDAASKIDKALRRTLKEGKFLTCDLGGSASTEEFTEEIINNLER